MPAADFNLKCERNPDRESLRLSLNPGITAGSPYIRDGFVWIKYKLGPSYSAVAAKSTVYIGCIRCKFAYIGISDLINALKQVEIAGDACDLIESG